MDDGARIDPQVLIEIEAEMIRAVAMHGELPRSGDRDLAILVEEVGEVAKALLEYNREDDAAIRRDKIYDVREELLQVIATGIRWINNIDAKVMM